MDPEYDLSKLGYPNELAAFSDLIRWVEEGGRPLTVTRYGRPVAAIVNLDELALLRQRVAELSGEHSDDSRTAEP